MLEGKAKVYMRKKKDGGAYIRLSSSLVKDSQFPFDHLDRLKVQILPEEEKIVIMKEE